MALHKKSSQVCVFCYKSIENSVQTSSDTPDYIRNFITILNRFTKSPDTIKLSGFLGTDNLLDCCHNCNDTIDTFCETYNQFKLLELTLDLLLNKLVEKINHANKVPERWINFNRILGETFKNDLSKRAKNQNAIRKFRQGVIETGNQRRLHSQPRVLIDRNASDIQLHRPSGSVTTFPSLHVQETTSTENQSTHNKFARRNEEEASNDNGLVDYDDVLQNDLPNPVLEKSTVFLDDDDGMPVLDDYSSYQNSGVFIGPEAPETVDEITDDYEDDVTMSSIKILKTTSVFKDPHIEIKLEHSEATNQHNIEKLQLSMDDCSTTEDSHSHVKARQNRRRKRKYIKAIEDYECSKCGKKLKTAQGLEIHLEFHKDPNDWKWGCKTCGKNCASEHNLETHMITHTKLTAFECRFCELKYRYKVCLKRHLLEKHGNEKGLEIELKRKRNS